MPKFIIVTSSAISRSRVIAIHNIMAYVNFASVKILTITIMMIVMTVIVIVVVVYGVLLSELIMLNVTKMQLIRTADIGRTRASLLKRFVPMYRI